MSELIEEYQRRLRAALLQLQKMDAQLQAQEQQRHEPIAIVGMACRFPGGCSTPDELFRFLEAGRDAVTEYPKERQRLLFDEPDAHLREHRSARWGAFLPNIDLFDASFFELSPREVARMDPQQRLLLEIGWEAFENAGVVLDANTRKRAGVFVGFTSNDYYALATRSAANSFELYDITGSGHCFPAGRIAYQFGLHGPCFSVDTACSSSLVAIHVACQTLRQQECDTALVAGVNLLLQPRISQALANSGALSPDGRARAFDAQANGFVRGEGCGAVVLMRLSDARRHGFHVHATILGSALNQDGRSAGFTAPNMSAQQALLEEAFRRARISPQDLGYIETHGTGTPLGDPIEAEALRNAFGSRTNDNRSCYLGAVKTNIGHLEACAGLAGLIKTVMVFQNERIPKNLHFRALNPRISFENSPLAIPKENTPWPRGAARRRAGVSSFGMSGTNAHVILEDLPPEEKRPPADEASTFLLPLSAKSAKALAALARAYGEWLPNTNDIPLTDIVYTASQRRTHHPHRMALVARTREELIRLAQSVTQRETTGGVQRGACGLAESKIVFVFPGQGSQWLGMGQQLFASDPIFRETIEACEAAIRRESGFSILDYILSSGDATASTTIEHVQPILFAMEVAIAALWRSWGVVPDCIIGHSMGEVAAAHIAGMLSLEDAVRVICRRSKLLKRIGGRGAMMLVELSLAESELAIKEFRARLGIAASNGPRSTILSGDPEALDLVQTQLQLQGVFCRRVNVDVASHSPQVDILRADLLSELREIAPTVGTLPMRSTVTGAILKGPELTNSYWADNLRQPVRLSQVTQDLINEKHLIFVEISPHPILLPSIEENLAVAHTEGLVLASMRRNTNERHTLLEAVGSLYVHGHDVTWDKLLPRNGRIVALPSYPWQREAFWLDPPRRTNRARIQGEHPLLGHRFDSSIAPGEHVWQQSLDTDSLPYLADHCIQEEVIFPGTGYVEMVLAATAAVYGAGVVVISEMTLDHFLALAPNTQRQIQSVLQKDDSGFAGIGIASRGKDEESWTRHATARVQVEPASRIDHESIHSISERCNERVDANTHYARLTASGLRYGPTFRGVQEVRVGTDEALGRIILEETTVETAAYSAHPALLDACLQVATWALNSANSQNTFVPRAFVNLRCYSRPNPDLWVHCRLLDSPTTDETQNIAIAIYDRDGNVVLTIDALHIVKLERQNQTSADPQNNLLFELAWREKPLPTGSSLRSTGEGAWLVVTDSPERSRAFAAHLHARGESCIKGFIASDFEVIADDEYRLDPTNAGHVQRLLSGVFGSTRRCKGVVHISKHEPTPGDSLSPENFLNDLRENCLGALRLLQGILVQGWRDVPRLYLITRGIQAVDGDDQPLSLSQAAIWGLGRTIALEHPAVECTLLDLASRPTADEGEAIVRELLAQDTESQVALRSSGRFVARMERTTMTSAPEREFAFRADRTYLITGGLGGLGLELAHWMVVQGARRLLLVGRSAPTPLAIKAISTMVALGADVRIARADVSKRNDVESLLHTQERELPPLGGIVHAAAVLADRTLLELTEETFLEVMGPKVLGALHLQALTAHQPLDFFLMYSSAAGFLGSPGQGNYSAANTVLDALARTLSTPNRPMTSIAWGPYGDVGLAAADDKRGKRLADRGIASISTETGHEIVGKLLKRPRSEVSVLDFAVRQWEEFFPQAASLPFLEDLRNETITAGANQAGTISFKNLLESTESSKRPALVQTHVLEQLGRTIRLDPARIDPQATFVSLGIDSLMSLELRNRLQASLGLELRATLLYTYPTANKLVGFLLEQLTPTAVETSPAAIVAPAPLVQQAHESRQPMDDLGADDLLAMLDEELAASKNRK